MNPLEELKDYIYNLYPDSKFEIHRFSKPQFQEMDIRSCGKCIVVDWMSDENFGVTVLDAENIWDKIFTYHPDTEFGSYENMKEYVIETLKCWQG